MSNFVEYNGLPGWQDSFIPDAFKYDDKILNRSRFFVTLFMVNIIVLGTAFVAFFVFNMYNLNNFYLAASALTAVVYGYIAYIFYFCERLTVSINLFLVTIFVSVFCNVLITAAIKQNIGVLLLPLLVVAFNLGGRKIGFFWTGVSIIMQAMLFLAYYSESPMLPQIVIDYGVGNLYSALHVCFLLVASTVAYESIIGKITEGKDNEREIFRFMAHHDPLTHLSNNLSFEAYYMNLTRKSIHFALIYIDLDNFKQVNDTFGHNAGDRVLCAVADRLQHGVRSADMAARLSGDEFAVIFAGMNNDALIEEKIALINEAISKPININGVSYLPTASIGYAMYPLDGLTFIELIDVADASMYKNKNKGKGKEASA